MPYIATSKQFNISNNGKTVTRFVSSIQQNNRAEIVNGTKNR